MGGFGMVGLWEFDDSDGDVMSVVVKQSAGKDRALRKESDMLRLIGDTETTHVVRMLKRYHEERGQGTSERWDPANKYISRIYLEYCRSGDMKEAIKRFK
jgi:hypothetical protein